MIDDIDMVRVPRLRYGGPCLFAAQSNFIRTADFTWRLNSYLLRTEGNISLSARLDRTIILSRHVISRRDIAEQRIKDSNTSR